MNTDAKVRNEEKPRGGSHKAGRGAFLRLFGYAAGVWPILATLEFCIVGSALLDLARPWIIGFQLFDLVIRKQDLSRLPFVILLLTDRLRRPADSRFWGGRLTGTRQPASCQSNPLRSLRAHDRAAGELESRPVRGTCWLVSPATSIPSKAFWIRSRKTWIAVHYARGDTGGNVCRKRQAHTVPFADSDRARLFRVLLPQTGETVLAERAKYSMAIWRVWPKRPLAVFAL